MEAHKELKEEVFDSNQYALKRVHINVHGSTNKISIVMNGDYFRLFVAQKYNISYEKAGYDMATCDVAVGPGKAKFVNVTWNVTSDIASLATSYDTTQLTTASKNNANVNLATDVTTLSAPTGTSST